ncbi:MAG: DivIVA domain-containing protein [Ruminococcaceae bacterium]|nr:DivIVA domain-containing protein [Oscillospiraceae bacterium]
MIPPHELKNKQFTQSFRGYNPAEVDSHIDFIIEKYTELYRSNLELDKQLSAANERLEQLSDEEEAIRKTLVKAQKMGETIIKQSQEKADGVILKIRERSEEIISETEKKLAAEKEALEKLRASADEFRENVLNLYVEQLKFLKESAGADIETIKNSIPEGGELKKQLLSIDTESSYDLTEAKSSDNASKGSNDQE